MRTLCFVLCVLLLPAAAPAQQSFSLPSIGLPLPAIGLRSSPWEQPRTPPWERPQVPEWERNRVPPWESGHKPKPVHDNDPRESRGHDRAVVYYVPYAVAVPQPPQVIVVQQPPVTQIVTVEVPSREAREDAAPAPAGPAPPPYVPGGDRTLYVIPGCYIGNVPPHDIKLPAACDARKVTTFKP